MDILIKFYFNWAYRSSLVGYFTKRNNGPYKVILCSTWTPQGNYLFNLDPKRYFFCGEPHRSDPESCLCLHLHTPTYGVLLTLEQCCLTRLSLFLWYYTKNCFRKGIVLQQLKYSTYLVLRRVWQVFCFCFCDLVIWKVNSTRKVMKNFPICKLNNPFQDLVHAV